MANQTTPPSYVESNKASTMVTTKPYPITLCQHEPSGPMGYTAGSLMRSQNDAIMLPSDISYGDMREWMNTRVKQRFKISTEEHKAKGGCTPSVVVLKMSNGNIWANSGNWEAVKALLSEGKGMLEYKFIMVLAGYGKGKLKKSALGSTGVPVIDGLKQMFGS